jgi:hypothetical protein
MMVGSKTSPHMQLLLRVLDRSTSFRHHQPETLLIQGPERPHLPNTPLASRSAPSCFQKVTRYYTEARL